MFKMNYRMDYKHKYKIKVDFNTFLDFKNRCLDRDQNASDLILETIKDHSVPNYDYKVLDIGSGEGKLIQEILMGLENKTKYLFDLIEPTKKGIRLIKKNLKEYIKSGTVRNFKTMFETFPIDENKNRYNIVICSHTFYHFRPVDWQKIIYRVYNLLAERGIFINLLASKETLIYKLSNIFRRSLSETTELKDEFGFYIFAEDYEKLLKKMKISFEKQLIISKLDYSKFYPKYIKGLNNLSLAKLVRNYCYLFRVDIDELDIDQFREIREIIVSNFSDLLTIRSYAFISAKDDSQF